MSSARPGGVASVLAALVLLASGCRGPDVAPDASSASFIAVGRDFEGFLDWPSVAIESGGQPGGHTVGPARTYLRGRVPATDLPFDVGTILVKATPADSFEGWEVHAMVKRGGGYNADGAVGWEWFDLALDASGVPSIAWRGPGTPSDPGVYASPDGGAGMACGQCHGAVPFDDYVFERIALGRID